MRYKLKRQSYFSISRKADFYKMARSLLIPLSSFLEIVDILKKNISHVSKSEKVQEFALKSQKQVLLLQEGSISDKHYLYESNRYIKGNPNKCLVKPQDQ